MGFISSSIEGDTRKQNEERGDYVRKGVKQTKKVLYQVGYYCEEVGLVHLETLKQLCTSIKCKGNWGIYPPTLISHWLREG